MGVRGPLPNARLQVGGEWPKRQCAARCRIGRERWHIFVAFIGLRRTTSRAAVCRLWRRPSKENLPSLEWRNLLFTALQPSNRRTARLNPHAVRRIYAQTKRKEQKKRKEYGVDSAANNSQAK
ncbi:hypothetical protein RB195_025247 [Necator americanus]|uniref:Uncharacterized protein n=1 Tax=Necator americanus TaxID=51031 RepID=A0ABR1ERG8_NECAM